MSNALLVDFGSTYTKVTAVDLDNEKILGTSRAFTTVESDIIEGLNIAINRLYKTTGNIEFSIKLASSSAAGGLKMVAIGLVPSLTVQAAKSAALCAGAKVMKVYSYKLNMRDLNEIEKISPDIILLAGGTNGGNSDVIVHNAKILTELDIIVPVIVAGNKDAAEDVCEILSASGKEVILCENVMPEFNVLNIEPARDAVREVFLKRIVRAKGLSKAEELIEGILMPTPLAVLKACRLISQGINELQGLGDVMAVDVGGATTDVYSISDGNPSISGVTLKGLKEPYDKRTVEGDLGVRYSAQFLVEEVGLNEISKTSGLTDKEILSYLNYISEDKSILPDNDEKFAVLDQTLAYYAVKIASNRHAGRLESYYSPQGKMFIQTGKDLSNVSTVIGTGGPVINAIDKQKVLDGILYDENYPEILKPKKVKFLVDEKYILAHMGLLSEVYPKIAFNILKTNLQER